jgi:spoIIIJ-associated protein
MPIDDLQQAAQKIAGLLSNLNKLGGLRLKYRISAGEAGEGASDPAGHPASHSASQDDERAPQLSVELSGPDAPLLTQHNGELLRALETVAAQVLRLDQREQSLIAFDADNFRALHEAELKLAAETAAAKVKESGVPYAFPPMNSRERRLLHIALREIEGVETASNGEGRDRFVAVYPAGKTHLPVAPQTRPPQSRPSQGRSSEGRPSHGRPRGFGRR